jgi:hypothetical protein
MTLRSPGRKTKMHRLPADAVKESCRPAGGVGVYESYKLCPDLRRRELCFVVEQYEAGGFKRVFHKHAPKSRLSVDGVREVLRALVAKFYEGQGMSAEQIVQAHFNSRGQSGLGQFHMVASYPEPGVLRFYCGANTQSWVDQVIRPADFRPGALTSPIGAPKG